MKKGLFSKCLSCSKDVYTRPYMVMAKKIRKFCNSKCQKEHTFYTTKRSSCTACGKVFFFMYGNRKFCSRRCSNKYDRVILKDRKCLNCKKTFTVSASKTGFSRKYCCIKCYWVAKDVKIAKKCAICGTEVKRVTCIANKYKNFYCSKKCQAKGMSIKRRGANNPNFVNGKSRESRSMKSSIHKNWRNAVLVRDNYTCQKCGKKEDILVHHIKNWVDYKLLRYAVENGLTLCRWCHYKIHSKKKGG